MNIIAIILARGGSKTIKNKNIIDIAGYELISYSIQAAKDSKIFNKIIVSTDSRKIAKVSNIYGAETPFYRSKKLSTDKVTSLDALKDALKKCEKIYSKKFDLIFELPCVSPLRDSKDIVKAYKILISKKLDSVTSYVNTGEKHPIRMKTISKYKDKFRLKGVCKEFKEPSYGSFKQDLTPTYVRNGAIYAMTRNCLLKQNSRHGKKQYPLIMSEEKSINIDTPYDLKLARLLIENGNCVNKPKKIIKNENIKTNKFNTKKLLVTTPLNFFKNKQKYLNEIKYSTNYINNINKKNLVKIIKNYDYWICQPSPNYKIDHTILQNAKKLKIISSPSTGLTHIDLKYCKKNKIKVLSISGSKDVNAIKASSEFTFLLMLNTLKKYNLINSQIKKNFWRQNENLMRSNELYKKTVAIVGFGRIGNNLFKFLQPFGVKIIVYDKYKKIKKNVLKVKKLLDIFNHKPDIIIICMSYNKYNKKLISEKFFSKMKKNSILINTSRGEIIDEKVFLKYLRRKKFRSGIDVLSDEQKLFLERNSLQKYSKNHDNLIITPHICGLTIESETKAFHASLNNIYNNE